MSEDGSSRDRLLRQKNEFIESFFRKGEEFTRELLDENDNLRRRIVELQQLRANGQPVSQDTLRELIERIHVLEKEREAMLARLTRVDDLEVRLGERFEEIERENHDLAALYVAQSQLHSSLDVSEIVGVCVEVLLNFVGASEFALLLADDSGALRVLAAHGFDKNARTKTDGLVAEAYESSSVRTNNAGGSLDAARRDPAGDEPFACLPLAERARTIGVIAIWGFLAQKVALMPIDQQLFEMLAASAGLALEAARLASRVEPAEQSSPFEQYSALL